MSNGLVEAVGEGTTNIIASDGIAETKVPVTVETKIALTGIVLSEDTLELSPDDAITVHVTLIPENANDVPETTSWTSGNTSVAVVDESGTITAIAEGETDMIYREGSFADTIVVYVSNTRPFNGPHTLSATAPCTVYAADFDFGGEGNAFHDSNSSNSTGNDDYRQNGGDTGSYAVEVQGSGFTTNIGYIAAGEWLVYTVEVKDAGKYVFELNESASETSAFHLEVDGTDVTGTITIPSNGSKSNYIWLELDSPIILDLTEGRHQIKFYFEISGYNFRALRFTKE